MGWSDRGPTEALHGTATTSEVLPTVSRPDGLPWAFVTSSGNDREKVPMFDPIGKGLNRPFFALGQVLIGDTHNDRPNASRIPVGIQIVVGSTPVLHEMPSSCALISEQLL